MGALFDSLEDAGYVERVEDPDDGRASRIRLTARGQRFARDAHKFAREFERRIARHARVDWKNSVPRSNSWSDRCALNERDRRVGKRRCGLKPRWCNNGRPGSSDKRSSTPPVKSPQTNNLIIHHRRYHNRMTLSPAIYRWCRSLHDVIHRGLGVCDLPPERALCRIVDRE
jgi:hypothetical protein